MKTTDFTAEQKQAVMDLLVLGMYADRNLACAEDACVQKLLDSFRFPWDFERDKFSDAAFTHTARHTESPDDVRAYVNELSSRFPNSELRQTVYNRLNDLLTSDGRVTTQESQLLSEVRLPFNCSSSMPNGS